MPGFIPWTAVDVARVLVQATQAATPTLTDFTRGSVLRSNYEAYGIVAEEMAQQIVAAADQTVQRSLERALNIQPQPAQAAYGAVTFTVTSAPTSNVTVPQGFTVAIPYSTLQFTVDASTVWEAGTTTLSVVVTCTVAGDVGNAPQNTITQIVSAVPSGLTGLTVTNLNDFTTGRNAQTDLDAAAQVPIQLAQLKAATNDAVAASALNATVQNTSGYVVEAVGDAVSATGGYVTPPSVAPVLTAETPSSATALAAGTYTVGYTWTTADGGTPLSPTASVTLTAGQAIQVSALTLPNVGQTPPSPNATGIHYYLSEAAGSTTLLYVASGTGASVTLTALPASGAQAPPTVNTAFAVTPGYATCWIANDLQTAPSSTLISNAQQQVDGYVTASGQPVSGTKGAGIVTTVVAAQLAPQNVTAALLLAPGYTLAMVQGTVEVAIEDYFAGIEIGQGLSWNTIIRAITNVSGVSDCTLTVPSANVAGVLGQRWILGTITLSLMA